MGSSLRNMHRAAGLGLVLLILAKELVAVPDPLDVVNIHLHLNEVDDQNDISGSESNRIVAAGDNISKIDLPKSAERKSNKTVAGNKLAKIDLPKSESESNKIVA